MKPILSYILEGILGNKDFEIVENVLESGFIELKTFAESKDMGIIIGKKGRIIKALRTILKTKATLDKVGFSLEVTEKDVKK